MGRIGYVVIEWNQMSHQPDLHSLGMYQSREDALEDAKAAEADTTAFGRKERFTVAEVLDQGDD